ncbi:MAG: tetratricopeptide repeat protein [Pirellulaceae bacterium]
MAEQRGMDNAAIANFEKARSLDPTLKGVAHSLAVLYDRAGRVDAAEREYAKALAENSSKADVYCDYGYFLYSTRRPEEAETHLRKALELSPDHKQSQVNLGLVLGSEGKFDEALQLFTTAIGPAAAQHNVGMLKLKQGDMDGARKHLSAAAGRDPSLNQTQEILASISDRPMIR